LIGQIGQRQHRMERQQAHEHRKRCDVGKRRRLSQLDRLTIIFFVTAL
jgi:hypothetical protein